MSLQRQTNAPPAPAEPAPLIEPPPFPLPDVADEQANGGLLYFGAEVREPWDYVPVPPVVLDDDGYLVADAMPQNDNHAGRQLVYGPALKDRYRGHGGMVGVDLSMPYVKGSPGKMLAPDLFVALSAEERDGRQSYKLWEEPAPDFVLEDLSPSNWRKDAVDKRELYRQLGVREYWMFDETGRRLRDESDARIGERLVGYWLCKGEYKRVEENDAGRLPSEVLNLELCVSDGLVRFYDPATGRYLPTRGEALAEAEAAQAEAAEERAGREAAQVEVAEERALRESAQAEAAEERAGREAALARIEALEAELRARR